MSFLFVNYLTRRGRFPIKLAKSVDDGDARTPLTSQINLDRRTTGSANIVDSVPTHRLTHTNYLRIEDAEGYVLIAVYLFIYLFVCMLFA